jgi:hypothetical protein
MPKSKHRRKPGGKSIMHPGRGKQSKLLIAERRAERQFIERYRSEFPREFPNEPAGLMLDLLSCTVQFNGEVAEFQPIAKAELFRQFVEPVDLPPDIDDEIEVYTLETAETALAFLVEHGMAEVSGDEVSIPDRFRQHIVDSGDEVAPGTSAEI